MERSDETLIMSAQRGDTFAFEELVQRYDRQVLSMAMNYTMDPEEAKDVYQEIFIRVFRGLPRFEFRSNFSTWLYRVAVNVCRTHVGRGPKAHHVSLDAPVSNDDERSLEELLPGGESAEESLLRRETSSHLRQALAELSPKQKIVFVLRHFHGLRLREIASALDCTEGTVKRHLFTATDKMRAQLVGLTEGAAGR